MQGVSIMTILNSHTQLEIKFYPLRYECLSYSTLLDCLTSKRHDSECLNCTVWPAGIMHTPSSVERVSLRRISASSSACPESALCFKPRFK